MTEQSATNKKAVSSNPNAVVFGRDEYGITSVVKREGLRAAGRVNGDVDKLKTLVTVLETLKEHAVARYKAQKEIVIADNKAAIHRAKVAAEAAEKDRLKKMKSLEYELNRLNAAAPEAK